MADSRKFSHMVYFTLQESSAEACDNLVAECKKYLSDHAGTDFFAAGVLADTTREVNDRDYQVALNIVFKDRASHDAYQVAERHDEFIAANKENWQQVRVFDSCVD
jgi:hypothetical protein